MPIVSQVEELERKPRLVGFKISILFTLPCPSWPPVVEMKNNPVVCGLGLSA